MNYILCSQAPLSANHLKGLNDLTLKSNVKGEE